MRRSVLVLRAGTGPGNNLIRSLRAGEPSLVIIGCHDDRFALKQSLADRNYLIGSLSHPGFLPSLRRVVETERVDLVIPTSDAEVSALAGLPNDTLPCRLFLPRPSTVELCQDKCALSVYLRERGIPAPATYPVASLDDIESLFERLGRDSQVWCRMRKGQGAMGAMLARSPEQARKWIGLWQDMQGTPVTAFALSEYLPGRDIAAQTLWRQGTLVLAKTYERLSYLGAGTPGGHSSIAALSKTVFDPAIVDACARAIPAIDPGASGVFVFDFKDDAHGTPRITEINAGRFGMSTNIFDLPGKHNMAATYVRLALDGDVEIAEPYDVAHDYYMVRDVDTAPDVYHAEDLFTDIEDARASREDLLGVAAPTPRRNADA
ncbi:MAG TPA: hypothetical protein VMS64_21195 [Candidatus Methylomirabilis sp.]|nr:hypothetical protein [Candidatus Methylomirabilis sp.]